MEFNNLIIDYELEAFSILFLFFHNKCRHYSRDFLWRCSCIVQPIEVKGGVPPFWASYLFHVKMTLLNAPGSWATLGQKLRSLLQNEGKDIIFSAIGGNFDKFCSFFTIG